MNLNSSYLIFPESLRPNKKLKCVLLLTDKLGEHISTKHLSSTAHNFGALCIIPCLKTQIDPEAPFSDWRGF